jgi:myo-inositol-1(or 4)-monophosphatase
MTILETAIEAARAAGQEIVRRLPQERDVHSKGFRDIVTDADLAAQETLASIIRSHFPHHSILSEEGLKPSSDADTVWVLDPLDGTTNYARRLPCFSVSIAVTRGDALVTGVVYDPLRDYVFCAERGAGATWNGQRLCVSSVDDLGQAVAGLDFAREPAVRSSLMATTVACSERIRTLRSFGSAALGLCYVAAGWLDAYFHFSLAPWDCAAGGLIVMEAGGTITETDGKPWSYNQPRCLATNGKLHSAFLGLIQESSDEGRTTKDG